MIQDEIYKSAKLAPNGQSSRHARIEDGADADDDTEAGPALPPADDDGGDGGDGGDGDGDYGPALPENEDEDEDEDGRFFGGGMTAQEREILDYVDGQDGGGGNNDGAGVPPEKIDAAWLRRTALNFERRINRNAEQRARFEAEPQRFIASEADLDADVKALSILGEHPELYADFAACGSAASLAGLLAHENADIAVSAVEIIGELTGEDVAAEEEQWGALVDALVEADLVGLLVSNLERLNEEDEADRSGVYYVLQVVENLCSRAATAETVATDALVGWLLTRIQRRETPVSQNKQYAAEILAILVQTAPANRRKLAGLDAADVMLQLVAAYRKRDPEKGGEEEEYMENLFAALTSIVDEPEGKAKFVAAEGVELCLIMLKEGKMSKQPALRVLDHAVGGAAGSAEACQKLVEAGGLKAVFTLFMKTSDRRTTEGLMSIFSWMLRLLPGDSPERIRTLAKFVEKDYEKIQKLVTLQRGYAARQDAVEQRIHRESRGMDPEEKEMMEGGWFLDRLDEGLYTLRTIDVILAWLVAEDDGARKKIGEMLADRNQTFAVIKASLQQQINGADVETPEGREKKEMLTTLADFLQ